LNAGPITERVYDALRRLILAREFRPGERLDPNQLAERLAASVTPVREALSILTGEQLVETRHAAGYSIPALDEPSLKDMYAWANEIAGLSLRLWRGWLSVDWDQIEEKRAGYADRVADLLEGIARASVNGEHVRAMEMINARLHGVRVIESSVLGDVQGEVLALEQALDGGDKARLRALLSSYHRRRIRAAPELVRAVYKAP
jgi:DNA-binding GntR family transcriptional regulator